MKVYVIREWWGRHVRSTKAPDQVAIPPGPVAKAGVAFDMIHWGDWALKPFAEKVIIYNFLAKFAIESLGLYGPAAVKFINASIAQSIIYEATWGLWYAVGLVALYAAVVTVMVYYAPDETSYRAEEVFPYRYVMRYNEWLGAADLYSISDKGRPCYKIVGAIGEVIIGEDRNTYYPLGPADKWDTGFLWLRRRSRFLNHQCYAWDRVWAEFIGFAVSRGGGFYELKDGFTDSYIKEIPIPFTNPYFGREWDIDYKFP